MSKKRPLSIIVAAFNAAAEIRVLLESLCASRFKDFEVCVCDDQSPDGTVEAIRSFADRLDIRLTVNAANRGVTYSRNEAAKAAAAPLLLFLDADVRLYPDTIGRLLERLESEGADVIEGVYTAVALDDDLFSRYYALFIRHSFLISGQPVEYNVFNAWCALCRREVWDALGGHGVVERGVEVENETLGRRIVGAGFKLLLDPSIAVDHHWGGHRKLVFIFTRRIYWWVKIFFATGRRFESSLTTPGYGLATLCLPAAAAAAGLTCFNRAFAVPAILLLAGFAAGYGPFYAFVLHRRSAAFCLLAIGLSMYFALLAAVSAVYSAAEELFRRTFFGSTTLSPESFR